MASTSRRISEGTVISTLPKKHRISMCESPGASFALVRSSSMLPMQATTRNSLGRIQSPLRLLLEKNTTAPRRSGTNSDGMTNGWTGPLWPARAGVEGGVVGVTMTLTETFLPGFR